MRTYHLPVMLETCTELLNLQAGKVYVDATLGGGGHSYAMLQRQPKIKLFAFDQDSDAINEAKSVLSKHLDNVTIIKSNFRNLRTMLAYNKIKTIDGILFDLGVSSHQIDVAERGFSFDRDATLDMRMDRDVTQTAAVAVNELSVGELSRIFKEYGEENAAGRIARAVDKARIEKQITTTAQLSKIIESVVGIGSKESLKTKVRIFQALRIYVNDELGALQIALDDAINMLAPEGRIVVMSYHSLEDRIVKNTFRLATKNCICHPSIINCVCNHRASLRIISTRPQLATEEELGKNIRARSAKLRAAIKIKGEK